MQHLTDVKGTALNKGRARVWVERSEAELKQYGFTRGAPIDVQLLDDHILIRACDDGKRKVAGREAKGKTICIFDLGMPVERRAEMFGGAEKLSVMVANKTIRIFAKEQ